MLNFIIGRKGAGKTTYIQNHLLTKIDKSKIMVIVPEQQLFETEKSYLSLLGPQKSSKIIVTAFSHLFDLILRTTGGLAGEYISDGSRNIFMNLSVEQASEMLDLYKSQVGNQSFASMLSSEYKELKECSITSDNLRHAAIKAENLTLSKKLNELALIFDIYEGFIANSYIDPLDNLTTVYNKLLEYNYFENYIVAIDSFTGFSAQELKIIERIMLQAENVYITLDGDVEEFAKNSRRFKSTQESRRKIAEIAAKYNIQIAKDIVLNNSFNEKAADLNVLEKYFYNNFSGVKCQNQNITLFSAPDVYEECEFVAGKIRQLVIDGGYRYMDITVIYRELEAYRSILDTTFQKYEIPYFMDRQREIDSKPIVIFMLSAFEIIINSFNSDYIFRFLKTGLANLTHEEISVLENYVYVWNISGKKWFSEFTNNPSGFKNDFSETEIKLLKKAESLRKYIIEPLKNFKSAVTDASGEQITKELFALLEHFNVATQLKNLSASFSKIGMIELSKEQASLWDAAIEVLNTMAISLGDRKITYKRYYDILKSVLSVTDVGFIPMDLDHVTIGSADRIRPNSPKAVFVIGAIDGDFPLTPSNRGIFSSTERKMLFSMNLPLQASLESFAANELLIAYSAVSAPSEKLFVSFYRKSLLGEEKAPSSIINELLNIFPNLTTETRNDENKEEYIWCRKQALEETIKNKQNGDDLTKALTKYFLADEALNQKLNNILDFRFTTDKKLSSKELISELYGNKLRLSASQVEKFYLCQFAYFCRYGLHIKEQKRAEINPSEYGSFIHYILEQILKNYKLAELESLEQIKRQELIDKITEEYLNSHLGGSNDKSHRFLYLFYRIKSTALVIVNRILEEFAQSSFVPIDFELKIGGENSDIDPYTLNLTDDKSITVTGFIDRVDIMNKENRAYIRIVDYKTGKKKFVLSDIGFGLNMQMLIYLAAVYKNGQKKYGDHIIPSGVLYLHADAPKFIAKYSDTEENIAQKTDKEFVMSGVILDDKDVITGMESEAKGKYIPVVISGDSVKKGGELLLQSKEINTLFSRIDKNLEYMAAGIFDGKISAVPAKGSYDACAYCPYYAACNFSDQKACNTIYSDKSFIKTLKGKEEE